MTTGKQGRCRWAALAASLALASLAPSSSMASTLPAAIEDLYLELTLNQVRSPRLAHLQRRDGRLYAQAATLRAIGLRLPAQQAAGDWLALDSLPGLRSDYELATQRLQIDVPVALLAAETALIGYEAPPVPRLDPATQAPGLLLNYELHGQRDRQQRDLAAWNELRLFGLGTGVLRSSSLARWRSSVPADASARQRLIRLDSSWQLDFPDALLSLSLGDAASGALAWSRSLRFGGLRLARNFGLQPYRVTVPLAAFAGEAVLPSVVDLYINGIREARQSVAPGRFELLGVPVLNGAGSAQMVVTDLVGQSRTISVPLYNSARLLQPGTSDGSVELGRLRRDYGLRSARYAEPLLLSASGRYGLSQRLTVEAHGETSQGLAMAGLGARLLLGPRAGVLSLAHAASHGDGNDGSQHSIGYEWQGPQLSISASSLRRSAGFRDIASLSGAGLARHTAQVFAGLRLDSGGQLGLSLLRQDGLRYAGLNASQSLGALGHLSLGLSRSLDGRRAQSIYLYWAMALDGRHRTWLSADHQEQGSAARVGALRSLPNDSDGWGWRLQGSRGEVAGAQAELSQLSRFGQWRAGIERWQHRGAGGSSGYAAASGGLLLMQGELFAMRRVHDAFALVSTDGIAEVPVLLENRAVGSTDGRGLLLVTPLNAWERNELAIDALELPADISVDRVRLAAVPATGSGVLARFPMRASLVTELALQGADGEWIAAGSSLRVEPGEREATVGYDGRVYLPDPPAGGWLRVTAGDKPCRARLPAALAQRGRIDLGVLACR